MRWFSPLCLCFLTACTSTPATTDAPNTTQPLVEHYVGEVTMLSPDGHMALGPARPTVAKRVSLTDQGKVEEWVWDEGELSRTTMTHVEGNRFSVAEDKARFEGTLNFEGEPWMWTSWTYDLTMTDGTGKLWGTGAKTETGLSTNKKFMSPEGEVRAQIRDSLTRVEEAEFEAKLAELKATHAARSVPAKPEPGNPETVPAGH